MTRPPVELSVVIPSLDRSDTLPEVVASLHRICVDGSLNVEVIVCDDASADETLDVAKRLARDHARLHLRVLHRFEPRRGYGAVVRYGLAHATGTYAAIVSADGQNPLDRIPRMLDAARKGAHLVQCSRYGRPDTASPVPRKFRAYQAAYRKATRLLLGEEFPDATYGFKLFDRVLVTALGLTSNRFSLSPEITFKVFLAGGRVEFVPGGPAVRSFDHPKFNLPSEMAGYGYVLLRAWLHRLGVLWF